MVQATEDSGDSFNIVLNKAKSEYGYIDILFQTDLELRAFLIKAVREITGLGLKDAKDLVDAAPKVIKEKVTKAEAEDMKKKLETAGATVTLK